MGNALTRLLGRGKATSGTATEPGPAQDADATAEVTDAAADDGDKADEPAKAAKAPKAKKDKAAGGNGGTPTGSAPGSAAP